MSNISDYYAPRVINPKKISHALIFSADEEIQKAKRSIHENMPWVEVQIINNPLAAAQFKPSGACVLLCDDTALNFLDPKMVRKNCPDLVIVLMSAIELIHCSPPAITYKKYPYATKADMIFAYDRKDCSPQKIITSIVRSAEDQLNIEKYSTARRYIFLVVDDEPRWASQFLPVLYDIIGQRAAIKLTRTYEETLLFLFGVKDDSLIDKNNYLKNGHGDDVVCLITDIFFPRGGKMQGDAGRDLIHLINKYYRRFPKIIASKASQANDFKSTAFTMPKGDPGSLQTLREYINDYTGMGDFLISSPTGKILYRIKNIPEMLDILKKAEKDTKHGKQLRDILEVYGKRDNFSTWLYMHGYKELANKVLPMRRKGRPLILLLKRLFEKEIKRAEITPLLIDGIEIYTLDELLEALRTIPPARIQNLSDNDVFSTWLDSRGFAELAEEIRPIHGKGIKLEKTLANKVEKWIKIYSQNKRKK